MTAKAVVERRAAIPAAPRAPRATDLAVAAACVAVALWTYRRALGVFFSPDDLLMLEGARGLLGSDPRPWRWLSGYAYFGAAFHFFGAHARPYHVVNWLLHGSAVALLFAWLRARGMRPAGAGLASGLFGASRLFVQAVYPATGIGELLALDFTLASFLTLEGGRSRAWWKSALAWLFFAAALVSKENVLVLPLFLLLPGSPERATAGSAGEGGLRRRALRAAPLLALGAAFALWLALSHVRSRSLGGAAYETGFGPNLFHNLMTYCAWATDFTRAVPDSAARIATDAWRRGWALLPALALLGIPRRDAREPRWPLLGMAWWILSLAPVLPLLHHSYLYYLYTPFVGLCMAAGGLLDQGQARLETRARRPPGARGAWPALGLGAGAAALAVVACAAVSDRLLSLREQQRMQGINLPADPFLRKCQVARNASADMAEALAEPGLRGRRVRAVIFSPHMAGPAYDAATGRRLPAPRGERPTYQLLEDALDGGRALVALHPQLAAAWFSRSAVLECPDCELFVNNAEGHLLPLGSGAAAHADLVQGLLHNGYLEDARGVLAAMARAYPADGAIRLQYAWTLDRLGRPDSAAMQLEELIRLAPGGPAAARARQVLDRLRSRGTRGTHSDGRPSP